jgi:hypothetical protein
MPALNFNAAETAPEMGFKPVPVGTYRMAIVESEQKENKAQTGHYIKFKFQIIEGEHKGRSVTTFLNLDHPKAQVVQIAQGELSCICHAVGVLSPQATEDLHNIELDVELGMSKDQNGEMQNKIKKYSKASVGAPAPAANNPFAK